MKVTRALRLLASGVFLTTSGCSGPGGKNGQVASPSIEATAQNVPQVSVLATYNSSNAGASCLPPPSQVSASPSSDNAILGGPAALTQSDLDSLQVNGVLGTGFHNYYLVATVTSPAKNTNRTVALHMWLSSAQYSTPGQTYTVAGTVSVLVAGAASSRCSTTWYPATVTYALNGSTAPDAKGVMAASGHYSVVVSGVGSHSGIFSATSAATLPAGADVESCIQTTVGTLPDFHSNAAPSTQSSSTGTQSVPSTTSSLQISDPQNYLYACTASGGEFRGTSQLNGGNSNVLLSSKSVIFTQDANLCYGRPIPSGTLTIQAAYSYPEQTAGAPTAVQPNIIVTLGNTPPLCSARSPCITNVCSPVSAYATTTGTLTLPGSDGNIASSGPVSLQATLPSTVAYPAQNLLLKATLIDANILINTTGQANIAPSTIPCTVAH